MPLSLCLFPCCQAPCSRSVPPAITTVYRQPRQACQLHPLGCAERALRTATLSSRTLRHALCAGRVCCPPSNLRAGCCSGGCHCCRRCHPVRSCLHRRCRRRCSRLPDHCRPSRRDSCANRLARRHGGGASVGCCGGCGGQRGLESAARLLGKDAAIGVIACS